MTKKKRQNKANERTRVIEALRKRADITVECLPEDQPIEGNASAWGDGTDQAYWDSLHEDLESGNDWAWCTVKVTATWNGYTESDYLGACSYKSQRDFVETSMYYEDMVNTTLGEIADTLLHTRETLALLGVE